jgi:hypothetical protein
MEVIYRADDGTEFEDEYECEEYEFRKELVGSSVVLLRNVRNDIEGCEHITNADYADVPDEKSAGAFIKMNNREGYCCIRWRHKSPDKEEAEVPPGVYYWEEEGESFELFDDKIARLAQEIADLEAQKRDISERAAQIRKERE